MKELYLANCDILREHPAAGCPEWGSIYEMINLNVSLVDRSERVIMPYRFKLYEPNVMPTDLSKYDLTYEQCCEKRATELYEKSKQMDLPLYVFYSGGIDSTLVLVSFLKVIPESDRDRLVVVMSMDSIRENPNFYQNHIRGKLTVKPSDRMTLYFDKKYLIIGGEHNDQLFGTDVIGDFKNRFSFEIIHSPYTREIVVDYFMQRGLTEPFANVWYEILHEHGKQAPCEIKTVFDFFWWYNFNFKWQSVFFRMILRVDKTIRKNIDKDFVNTYFHHFFTEDYFQIWSMSNKQLKIKHNWESYKFHAKEVIYDYTKDQEYRDFKMKAGSLYKLFLQRDTPVALSSEYEYIYDLDPNEFYVPNNSFMR